MPPSPYERTAIASNESPTNAAQIPNTQTVALTDSRDLLFNARAVKPCKIPSVASALARKF
jgi:hypothetical protein